LDSTGELYVVKKVKTSERLVNTIPCPIKAILPISSITPVNKQEDLGVTALVAIMEPATEQLSLKAPKIPLRNCPNTNNRIRVLLDTGSNGDLFFYEKGKPKPFPYLTRQVPKSWHTSNGTFQTKGRGNLRIKFLDYSTSKEYLAQPDIVEYDGTTLGEPGFYLILGTNTLKELGITLNFWMKEIDMDEIILPMRDITKLSTTSKIKRAWMANNGVVTHEPKSTFEATQWVGKILDAKYEKADLNAVVFQCCDHLNNSDQEKLLKLRTEFEDLFDRTLGDWDTKPVSLKRKEGAKPYHVRPFPTPKVHQSTLRKEVERLCKLGVLKWQPESEWASPSFILPKQDQTV